MKSGRIKDPQSADSSCPQPFFLFSLRSVIRIRTAFEFTRPIE